jgi:hypothetical protein
VAACQCVHLTALIITIYTIRTPAQRQTLHLSFDTYLADITGGGGFPPEFSWQMLGEYPTVSKRVTISGILFRGSVEESVTKIAFLSIYIHKMKCIFGRAYKR